MSHLIYSFEEEDQSKRRKDGNPLSPLQYMVSIQPGLSKWMMLAIKSLIISGKKNEYCMHTHV